MPRKDGTGPMGRGPKTGRGLGNCQNKVTNWGGRNNPNKTKDQVSKIKINND